MKSTAINIPGRRQDFPAAQSGSSNSHEFRSVLGSPPKGQAEATSPARSIGGYRPAPPGPSRSTASKPDAALAWTGRLGSTIAEVGSSCSGDIPEAMHRAMEAARLPKLSEARREAEARGFSGKADAAICELKDHIAQFQRAHQGSIQHAQLGYQIFRHGMELGELSKQWFITNRPEPQAKPHPEVLHHAELGRIALAKLDWQTALSALKKACSCQTRFQEAVSELGLCAQQLAAWHLAQVGHLPNPESFTQGVHGLVARYQSLESVIQIDPKNPKPRRHQNQVLSELVQACESWSANLGRFAQPDSGMFSWLVGRKTPAASVPVAYQNDNLQSCGDAVANNPSAIGAIEALKHVAEVRIANNASDIPKLEEAFQVKLRLERYKAEMQQHYNDIDQWVGRSPQGDPMRPVIEANRLNWLRSAR